MHTFHQQQIAKGTAVDSECQLVSAADRSDQMSSIAHTPGMSGLTNSNSRGQHIFHCNSMMEKNTDLCVATIV